MGEVALLVQTSLLWHWCGGVALLESPNRGLRGGREFSISCCSFCRGRGSLGGLQWSRGSWVRPLTLCRGCIWLNEGNILYVLVFSRWEFWNFLHLEHLINLVMDNSDVDEKIIYTCKALVALQTIQSTVGGLKFLLEDGQEVTTVVILQHQNCREKLLAFLTFLVTSFRFFNLARLCFL